MSHLICLDRRGYANGDMSSSRTANRKNLRLSNVISILSCDSQGAWNPQLFLSEMVFEINARNSGRSRN
jgi:hypothetical protein